MNLKVQFVPLFPLQQLRMVQGAFQVSELQNYSLSNWSKYYFTFMWVECRLFSCGTIKDVGTGSPFLVEWGELNEGIIKCYLGLSTHTDEALQFDMANDHILAIGDDSIVKFWNVDKREPLYYVDAGGGLPVSNKYFLSFLWYMY